MELCVLWGQALADKKAASGALVTNHAGVSFVALQVLGAEAPAANTTTTTPTDGPGESTDTAMVGLIIAVCIVACCICWLCLAICLLTRKKQAKEELLVSPGMGGHLGMKLASQLTQDRNANASVGEWWQMDLKGAQAALETNQHTLVTAGSVMNILFAQQPEAEDDAAVMMMQDHGAMDEYIDASGLRRNSAISFQDPLAIHDEYINGNTSHRNSALGTGATTDLFSGLRGFNAAHPPAVQDDYIDANEFQRASSMRQDAGPSTHFSPTIDALTAHAAPAVQDDYIDANEFRRAGSVRAQYAPMDDPADHWGQDAGQSTHFFPTMNALTSHAAQDIELYAAFGLQLYFARFVVFCFYYYYFPPPLFSISFFLFLFFLSAKRYNMLLPLNHQAENTRSHKNSTSSRDTQNYHFPPPFSISFSFLSSQRKRTFPQ